MEDTKSVVFCSTRNAGEIPPNELKSLGMEYLDLQACINLSEILAHHRNIEVQFFDFFLLLHCNFFVYFGANTTKDISLQFDNKGIELTHGLMLLLEFLKNNPILSFKIHSSSMSTTDFLQVSDFLVRSRVI